MIIIGTSHFKDIQAAMSYYMEQEQIPTVRAARFAIDRKLNEGLIHIGKPTLKPGERLSLIDEGRRYAITEPE